MFEIVTEEFIAYCMNCGTETKFEYQYTEWGNGEKTHNHEKCNYCGANTCGEYE